MSEFRPKFWKPGTDAPGVSLQEERGTTAEGSGCVARYNPNVSLSVEQQRQRLPIFQYRNHVLYLLEQHRVVVIVGETGCGKSTQIPQYLYEAGWTAEKELVGIVQPRRVAAITVATRVAEEMAAVLGHVVGYTIRFEDCSSANATRIKFMTDGLLVREIMDDPLLSKYKVIMLDEAHERTLYTDICVGLLKKIMNKRKDLKLIIASATLDADKFRDFYSTGGNGKEGMSCAVLSVEGRQFPVELLYSLDPVPDYIKATVETAVKIHHKEKEGDILCFLTGQEEVETAVSLLIEEARRIYKDSNKESLKMKVLPLYGALPAYEQMKVFERTPRNTRKIVVATNIAETSVTINGIVYVIDSGFVKLPAYNHECGIEALLIIPESQASANQRAGRAGRVRSGKAYRLFPEEQFEHLPEQTVPEMQRSNMAAVILKLKALGINNVLRFDFLDPPPAQNMIRGLEILYALGAIDSKCQLTTPLGLNMAEFPLQPMYAKMLLTSEEFGCSEEILTIAAMMQIQNVFLSPSHQKVATSKSKRNFSVEQGDHVTMLNVYEAFLRYKKSSKWCSANFLNYKGLCRAVEVRKQLEKLCQKFCIESSKSCEGNAENIQRCITAGFFANAAKYHHSGVYKTARDDHTLYLHPTSVLAVERPPAWVVFNEVVHTSKLYMRDITVIKPDWLYELAPHFYEFGTQRELAAKRLRLEK